MRFNCEASMISTCVVSVTGDESIQSTDVIASRLVRVSCKYSLLSTATILIADIA